MDYPYIKNQYWYTGTAADPDPQKMKILIGTPIHESKDYAMERWLENVSKMDYPADLMMVDSSFDTDYVSKVKEYCSKLGINPVVEFRDAAKSCPDEVNPKFHYGVTNYKIAHIDVPKFQPFAEKRGRSREVIRQEILKNDYDAWLSWGCDKIVPVDALSKISAIMEKGEYMMVHANTWARGNPPQPSAKMDFSLVKRGCLEKYGFSLEYPDMPDCWGISEEWFKKQVLKGGDNYVEVYGIIGPIFNIDKLAGG